MLITWLYQTQHVIHFQEVLFMLEICDETGLTGAKKGFAVYGCMLENLMLKLVRFDRYVILGKHRSLRLYQWREERRT